MNKFILLLIFTLCSLTGYSQISQQEKIRQDQQYQRQRQNSEIMNMMEQGVDLMEQNNYKAAEQKFKQVLQSAKVIPSDLCYFFGKNSFYLNKFQQSIDWLNKYVELKGTGGRYYNDCLEYLEKSKKAFLSLREAEREEAKTTILSSNYDIDCGPSGKVVCPVCKGKGVIITKGTFGDTYRACPYSDEHGYLTCEEYNQLLRGELKPKQ